MHTRSQLGTRPHFKPSNACHCCGPVSGQRLRGRDEFATPAPRASGTLLAHYAPSAPVRLMDAKALQTALDLLGADAARLALYARAPLKMRSSRVDYRRMPDDAAATAQQLFAVLRDFDAAGARLIWIETPHG